MKDAIGHWVVKSSDWMERQQIPLYGISLVGAIVFGLGVPAGAANMEHFVDPLLITLIYATFISVPVIHIIVGFRDTRYLTSILALNFLGAPLVVFVLGRLLIDAPTVLIPMVLVLCAPCIDYVMVFTRLAGGTWVKTLAAAPILLVVQMVLLPMYVWIIVPGHAAIGGVAPFVRAFGLFIVVPLLAAVATRKFMATLMGFLMVPLMMGVLFMVVSSQFPLVIAHRGELVRVVIVYVLFVMAMVLVATWVTAWRGHPGEQRRALLLSSVTRNSLVVLPFALALGPVAPVAPVVVVTQTLVELIIMVILLWVFTSNRARDWVALVGRAPGFTRRRGSPGR